MPSNPATRHTEHQSRHIGIMELSHISQLQCAPSDPRSATKTARQTIRKYSEYSSAFSITTRMAVAAALVVRAQLCILSPALSNKKNKKKYKSATGERRNKKKFKYIIMNECKQSRAAPNRGNTRIEWARLYGSWEPLCKMNAYFQTSINCFGLGISRRCWHWFSEHSFRLSCCVAAASPH